MKKNIIKALFVSAIGLMTFTLAGCDDLLDQKPQGQWVKGDGGSGSFQSDVFTLYAKIRSFDVTAGNGAMAIHSFRSEDAEKGSTAGDGAAFATMFDDFEYSAANGSIGSYWTGNYSIINLVNSILSDMKDIEDTGGTLTESDLTNKSEAHFFRAFAYFNLVRAFGEVPKIDFKVTDAAQTNIAKSSVETIYQLIDSDLTEAVKYLPLKWNPAYIGRLTSGAARSLHAKTYLTRNNWASTYAAATEVINSGIYNLNTAYDQIFRETGENCSESIFEIQCTATTALPSSLDIGCQYAAIQGVRGAGDWNLGWGWNTPTQLLADAFETGDPRKDETLLYFLKTGQDPATIQANKPYNDKPIAAAEVTNKYYNKKIYTNPALRVQFAKNGFWMNIRLLRYADIVLMAAEAANELGNSADALKYLEMVRARARGSNANVLPKVTTTNQADLRTAIRHERRVELGMEYDRFYDLVRWGVAAEVLHAAGKIKYQDKHKYLPLPQAEIDKSNGVLKQNPNY